MDIRANDVTAAGLADGKFVIALTRAVPGNEPRVPNRQYLTARAVVAQVFTSDGTRVGGEVMPDQEVGAVPGSCPTSARDFVPCPTPLQQAPQVMPLQGGGYVLAWSSWNRTGVQGARMVANGMQVSPRLQLTNAPVENFAVTATAGATPVLAWTPAGTGSNVFATQFPASGPQ
jgi:hypothetical protein